MVGVATVGAGPLTVPLGLAIPPPACAKAAGAITSAAAAPRHKSLKVISCTSLPSLVLRAPLACPFQPLENTPATGKVAPPGQKDALNARLPTGARARQPLSRRAARRPRAV